MALKFVKKNERFCNSPICQGTSLLNLKNALLNLKRFSDAQNEPPQLRTHRTCILTDYLSPQFALEHTNRYTPVRQIHVVFGDSPACAANKRCERVTGVPMRLAK